SPHCESLARGVRIVWFIEQVEGGTNFQCASCRRFDLAVTCACHHDGEIHLNEFQKAVAFDQNTGRADSFERELNALLHLAICRNYPVNSGRAGVPVTPRILARSVSLRTSRTDERLIA